MDDDTGKRADGPLTAISGLDDPVRRALYDYVRGQAGPVGRDEAAQAGGMGRSLAAYHLDKLVDLGLLTAAYRRPEGRGGPGAGRPAKVYAPSAREFAVTVPPREYELAARLMAQAVESDPSGAAMAALRQSSGRCGAGLGGARGTAGGQDSRQAITAVLAEHGFEPRHDADGSIRLRNCPFHQLAVSHREVVCGMNLALLSGLSERLGPGTLRAILDPAPGRCCVVIQVRDPASPPSITGAS